MSNAANGVSKMNGGWSIGLSKIKFFGDLVRHRLVSAGQTLNWRREPRRRGWRQQA